MYIPMLARVIRTADEIYLYELGSTAAGENASLPFAERSRNCFFLPPSNKFYRVPHRFVKL